MGKWCPFQPWLGQMFIRRRDTQQMEDAPLCSQKPALIPDSHASEKLHRVGRSRKIKIKTKQSEGKISPWSSYNMYKSLAFAQGRGGGVQKSLEVHGRTANGSLNQSGRERVGGRFAKPFSSVLSPSPTTLPANLLKILYVYPGRGLGRVTRRMGRQKKNVVCRQQTKEREIPHRCTVYV